MSDSTTTVLLVDDSRTSLAVLVAYLGESNYDLVRARDGVEALRLLTREPTRYHAVLLDLEMPRMSGLEVLRRMKTHAQLTHVPVIIQTASSDSHQVAEGLAAGARYYLIKPFLQDKLQAKRLGLSKSGVFSRIGSREALQKAVIEEYDRRFLQDVFVPAMREPRGLPRLNAIMRLWLQRARDVEIRTGCIYCAGAFEFDDREGPLRDLLLDRTPLDGLARFLWPLAVANLLGALEDVDARHGRTTAKEVVAELTGAQCGSRGRR